MRASILAGAALALLSACGERQQKLQAAATAVDVAGSVANGGSGNAAGKRSRPGGELINPDSDTMVLLYYALARIEPPLDEWVEQDRRVLSAQPIDKAAQRKSVLAELKSAAAAVRGIDRLQLSMNASLSQYDPAYGEFMVGAFAPSSVVTFAAFKQEISLKFSNAKRAYLWKVPANEAQAVRDKIGHGNVTLDATLHITGVQPGPGGGTLLADVIDYEMRESTRQLVIGRVSVDRN